MYVTTERWPSVTREERRPSLSNPRGSMLRPVPHITSQKHLVALVSVTFGLDS